MSGKATDNTGPRQLFPQEGHLSCAAFRERVLFRGWGSGFQSCPQSTVCLWTSHCPSLLPTLFLAWSGWFVIWNGWWDSSRSALLWYIRSALSHLSTWQNCKKFESFFFTIGRKWGLKKSQTYSDLGKEKIKQRGKWARLSPGLGMGENPRCDLGCE